MVKTEGDEYFYMVSGLMIPKYKVDERLAENIEFFIDWASKNAANLEHLVEVGKYDQFFALMDKLYEVLCDIYAHWLEMECARVLRMADIKETDIVKRLITPFVANLRTLAIDIQMAQNKGFEASYRQRDDIERYRGEINTLKIISTLLKNEEYEKAFDLAIGLDELSEYENSGALMESIVSMRLEKAQGFLDKLAGFYQKKIDDFVDSTTQVIVQKKVLIVDDMPEELEALSYMLMGSYQVFAFSDAKEAIHFVENKQPPDAFILDIDMPEMDGFALAKRIRTNMMHSNTPILFLTGNSSRETILKSVLYKPKAFIVKPATKEVILSKLCAYLN